MISVERGHDPRDFALVAFGGAGGLHACALATALGIGTVIVPRDPGVLSALGAATTEVAFDRARTVMTSLGDRATIDRGFDALERNARQDRGGGQRAVRVERFVDARYRGQSYELTVPWSDDAGSVATAVHAAHEERYGFSAADADIEIVTIRLRRVVRRAGPAASVAEGRAGVREATVAEGRAGRVIDRVALAPDAGVRGPALLVEPYATTWVAPGWSGIVERHGHLVLQPEAG